MIPCVQLFQVEPANACAAFKNLRAAENDFTVAGRAHCEDLWKDFEGFADPDFVTEFATRMHERWFEMYLTVTLLRAGFAVECRKPGPDVLITVDGRRIWIEATVATPGEPGLPDSVPPRVFGKVTATPIRQMALRVRNALSSKEKVFRGYLDKKIVAPEDLLVLAINVHEIPNLPADMDPVMKRAFYGVGDQVLTISRETLQVVDSNHEQLTHIAKVSTGAEVGVQPLIDGSTKHISAVLGSRADAVNLPKEPGGDLLWLPNLTATRSWPTARVPLGDEWSFVSNDGGWDGKRIRHGKA